MADALFEQFCNPDVALRKRLDAGSLLFYAGTVFVDDDKDRLVQLLNEPDAAVAELAYNLLAQSDNWVVVGVAHGLLVRCRSSAGEQMAHRDGLADADLGEVVDLEDIGSLCDRLAAPSRWLQELRHERVRLMQRR